MNIPKSPIQDAIKALTKIKAATNRSPAKVAAEVFLLASQGLSALQAAPAHTESSQFANDENRRLAGAPAQGSAFPERDPTVPAEQQGLFHKFDVRHVDGSDAPGGKHHGCQYFVLDLDHDAHAPAAMRAYAAACAHTHPAMAADLVRKYSAPAQGSIDTLDDALVESIEYWARAYATSMGGGHGMVVMLLREYASLVRVHLAQRVASGDAARKAYAKLTNNPALGGGGTVYLATSEIMSAFDEHFAQRAASSDAPEGWALRPVVADRAMIEAAMALDIEGEDDMIAAYGSLYEAMTGAAPTAPAPAPIADEVAGKWAHTDTEKLARAERALIRAGFEDRGGQEWAPPIGKPPRFISETSAPDAPAGDLPPLPPARDKIWSQWSNTLGAVRKLSIDAGPDANWRVDPIFTADQMHAYVLADRAARAAAAPAGHTEPVAVVVSRHGSDLRVGWLLPELCEVGTKLFAAPVAAEPAPAVPAQSGTGCGCVTSGAKRCPHATDHRNACTNSNESGQMGSSCSNATITATPTTLTEKEKEIKK